MGYPAIKYRDYNKSYVHFKNLPEIIKKLDKFFKKIMMSKQQTISKSVSLKGVGIHSGNDVNLTFKPAEEDFGYAFIELIYQKNQ